MMNPPTTARANKSTAVSLAARVSPKNPLSSDPERERVVKIADAKVTSDPDFRGFRFGRSAAADSDREPPPEPAPARGGLAAAEPGEGQTIGIAAPRSAFSRSSVKTMPKAA